MASPIVLARDVQKVYQTGKLRVQALKDLNLEVQRGEMLAVMGPSGCGKTTLLNCLSGLDGLTAGHVYLEDRDLATLTDVQRTHLRSRRMGFVFQSFNLLPVLTAQENVELPLLVAGVDPRGAKRRAREALKSVGLAEQGDQHPNELSGGQQQRVTIARSIVNDPAIVWADEPTGNLDTETGQEIMDLMHRLNREKGQTYVLVTHDPVIAKSCHRVVHMESGRIVRIEQGQGRLVQAAGGMGS